MKNREAVCFALYVRVACTISELEDLNAEAVKLAATIKKKFEELGV